MRGMTDGMSVGERVAFYRKRRGMSQEVLAGLAGRTEDWLRKAEHDRIPLDRLSVIRDLAGALDVSLGDLIGEPTLMEWSEDSGQSTVSAVRVALMDHRQFLTAIGAREDDEPVDLDTFEDRVTARWADYQNSHYSRLARRLPALITDAQIAARQNEGEDELGSRASGLLASVYQLAASFLTKLGEADLACVSASSGLTAAYTAGDELVIGSLLRTVGHALLSIGECEQSAVLMRSAAEQMSAGRAAETPEYLSVYGMLHLVGAVASSRQENREGTRTFLDEADAAARRLGRDANYFWTAFGPTNVAIHRTTAAMELGDVQVAIDQGTSVDLSAVPVERRVRHMIETARAFARWNRTDDAMNLLLAAEHEAPEQVRYHRLSRLLVREMLRRPRVDGRAVAMAQRMGVGRPDL